jgi:hypothetical protein
VTSLVRPPEFSDPTPSTWNRLPCLTAGPCSNHPTRLGLSYLDVVQAAPIGRLSRRNQPGALGTDRVGRGAKPLVDDQFCRQAGTSRYHPGRLYVNWQSRGQGFESPQLHVKGLVRAPFWRWGGVHALRGGRLSGVYQASKRAYETGAVFPPDSVVRLLVERCATALAWATVVAAGSARSPLIARSSSLASPVRRHSSEPIRRPWVRPCPEVSTNRVRGASGYCRSAPDGSGVTVRTIGGRCRLGG